MRTSPLDRSWLSTQLQKFHQQIDRSRLRVRTLQSEVSDEGTRLNALEELDRALEEMTAADEEMRVQNEALLDVQEQLVIERERFERLFREAPEPYIATDDAVVIRHANRAAALLLRVPEERLIGRPLAVFTGISDRRKLRRFVQQAITTRGMHELEMEVRTRTDARVAVRARVIADRTGADAMVLWLLTDLTVAARARAAEQELGRERAARIEAIEGARRLRFLAEAGRSLAQPNSTDELAREVVALTLRHVADYCAYYEVSPDGLQLRAEDTHARSRDAARALQLLFGLSQGDPGSPFDRVLQTRRPVFLPPGPGQSTDIIAELRAGSPRHAAVLPVIADETLLGLLVLVSTQTENLIRPEQAGVLIEFADRMARAILYQKTLEREREANRVKSDFLATLSHELRTPLTSVMGYAELLLGGIPETLTPGVTQSVERIRDSASYQLTLIEQLLTLVRLEHAPQPPFLEPVNLGDLLTQIVALVDPHARAKQLYLHFSAPATPIISDRNRLKQILVNLIWNAIKFTDQGEVEITARNADELCTIEVRDTGCGIEADALASVFEPFWQADDYPNHIGGIGMGLTISRRLTASLGGSLRVDSTVGAGSTFTVEIPITTTRDNHVAVRD